MSETPIEKKYSKISPALKCCFLKLLYFKNMTIKEVKSILTKASKRCNLNYSTAKVLIRDLNPKERKFIKRLIRSKERLFKKGPIDPPITCTYECICSESCNKREDGIEDLSNTGIPSMKLNQKSPPRLIEIVSTTGFDYFRETLDD